MHMRFKIAALAVYAGLTAVGCSGSDSPSSKGNSGGSANQGGAGNVGGSGPGGSGNTGGANGSGGSGNAGGSGGSGNAGGSGGSGNAGGSSGSGGSGNADGSGGSGNASGTGNGGNLGTGGIGDPDAGGSSGSSGTAGTDGGGEPPGKNCLKGTGNYVMNGPYTVASKTVTIGSKGQFTIYYPNPLEAACPHPIVAWGNGTTITGGTAYDHFLKHAGSWGIVSIASHNSNVGDGTFHRAAIDYLLEQNKSSGSEFFGKLSTKAGVTGHSQGGAGGDRASNHANVKANVNVQGSFGTPPPGTAAFLCLTGTEDIQPTGCPRAVMAATVPALSASWAGADHVSTTLLEGEGIEQYKRLFSAWFRCFLADDDVACALFKGAADCPVCKESGWDEIFAKNY
jgi:hypothetical protein